MRLCKKTKNGVPGKGGVVRPPGVAKVKINILSEKIMFYIQKMNISKKKITRI